MRADIQYNDGFAEKWIYQLSPADWRGKVTVEFVDVPVVLLECSGSWTDPDIVEGWVRTIQDGRSIPPPVAVRTESGMYYLHDGNHRYMALAQHTEPDALVRVAVAVPLPGYRFEYQQFEQYGTYVISDLPRRFTRTAQTATALMATSAATAMTLLVSSAHDPPSFVIFAASIVVAAWIGGVRSALLTTVANALAAAYFILPPNHSFSVQDASHAKQLAVSILAMLAVSLFIGWARQHRPMKLGLLRSGSASQ
jgi:hypothetical protein